MVWETSQLKYEAILTSFSEASASYPAASQRLPLSSSASETVSSL